MRIVPKTAATSYDPVASRSAKMIGGVFVYRAPTRKKSWIPRCVPLETTSRRLATIRIWNEFRGSVCVFKLWKKKEITVRTNLEELQEISEILKALSNVQNRKEVRNSEKNIYVSKTI